MTEPAQPKKSDLGVRVLSAIVMVSLAGTALWLGGWVWLAFVALVALGVLWEWWGLASKFAVTLLSKSAWLIGGLIYVGSASAMLVFLRSPGLFDSGFDAFAYDGCPPPNIIRLAETAFVLLAVIGVDVGAYFVGRGVGGPKIAPKLSPSKTWAGLFGGAVGAALIIACSDVVINQLIFHFGYPDICPPNKIDWSSTVMIAVVLGPLVAVVAQAGDFFESWMKRRAGVKDSGTLIPGHGGLFDRVDGLIAVCFVIGLFALLTIGGTLATGGSLLPTPA